MARIAVVGATGQIGAEVVRLLVGGGHEVRALVRDAGHAQTTLSDGIDLLEGDMRDSARHGPLLTGADALFVVSSDPSLEPPIFRSAGRMGVPLVVKSSAVGFGGAAPSGHAAAEAVLVDQPVGAVILRPNAFMQTLRSYLPRLIEADGSFALPAGNGATAWVDTRDIAAVAATVLTSPPPDHPTIHLVTGPAALTMSQVAQAVSATTGRTVTFRPLAADEAEAHLVQRLGPMGAFLAEHYIAVAAGGFTDVATTVPELTGSPARSLHQLIREDPTAWTAEDPRRP